MITWLLEDPLQRHAGKPSRISRRLGRIISLDCSYAVGAPTMPIGRQRKHAVIAPVPENRLVTVPLALLDKDLKCRKY